jgi:methylated-DNA-[protein]-cysteine S-methyltransferase
MDVPMRKTLVVSSPIGPLTLTAEAGALTGIDFGTPAGYAGGASSGAAGDAAPAPPVSPVLAEAGQQLAAYFASERREFDLPLRPSGTPFQLTVWEALRRIPYGETVTYSELAAAIGRPAAARAVGSANHHNPLAIVVPCHRVIGADGTLTGYAGGLATKAALLALESGRAPTDLIESRRGGSQGAR